MYKYLVMLWLMIGIKAQAQDTFKIKCTEDSLRCSVDSFYIKSGLHAIFAPKTTKGTVKLPNGKTIRSLRVNSFLYIEKWCYYIPLNSLDNMDAYYFQKPNPNLDGYYQFFYKSGKISREGYYDNKEKTGKWINWYPNGQKKGVGYYYEGFKIGHWTTWYKNGSVKSEENFISDTLFLKACQRDGVFKYVRVKENDKAPLSQSFSKKELHTDTSVWFYPNGQMSSLENWDVTLLRIRQWDSTGKRIKTNYSSRYNFLYRNPKFKGALAYFFKRKLNINNSKLKEIKKIEVCFVVEKNGKINQIKVFQPKDNKLESKIINAVQEMKGKWKIASIHNLPKSVRYDIQFFY